MITHRRFIAGAVCPRCGELDKIYVFHKENTQWRACVRCDFEEAMEHQVTAPVAEIPTRVTPKANPTPADDIQVLTIRDSSSGQPADKSD